MRCVKACPKGAITVIMPK
ncbi:MAG: hypothetical protein ACTSXJ_05170 [Candidatus Baldrarchaeia archaeon]